ncbi:hypothetical protein BCR43DRAFT_482976 [Syncephalastrum racemosum]|uniref:Uncharacterized protein n=1 Tax=Syncephalastrum racemosum TaxID=13706 RepID=A0A1X2HUI7_SYNRA|nr:hypothetical protein BCR43DRAFT_482976 [Syncephalastrum racemosum]
MAVRKEKKLFFGVTVPLFIIGLICSYVSSKKNKNRGANNSISYKNRKQSFNACSQWNWGLIFFE